MSGQSLQGLRATLPKALLVAIIAATAGIVLTATAAEPTGQEEKVSGKELFHREWLPNDPRSHGGDGLGPVFNDSSCVACHNQGGSGGGGAFSKNVELLTSATRFVVPRNASNQQRAAIEKRIKQIREQLVALHPGFRDADTVVLHHFGTDAKHDAWRLKTRGDVPSRTTGQVIFDAPVSRPSSTRVFRPSESSQAGSSQAGPRTQPPVAGPFPLPPPPRNAEPQPNPPSDPANQPQPQLPPPTRVTAPLAVAVQSVPSASSGFPVVERAKRDIARLKQAARNITARTRSHGGAILQTSQRNTTALFGVGLIDEIPNEAIEAVAKLKYEDFPHVTGRVHHLKDGKIGRFGWKAQKGTLHDFTMAACGVELGLHVPDHPQSAVPYDADKKPQGFDLTRKEANALVDYLRKLPGPVQQTPSNAEAAKRIEEGEGLFVSVGCAACHTRKVGEVDGLFSDLLLHDMGPELGGTGHYGASPTPSPDEGDDPQAKKVVLPTATEWRTPPLWGCRDSAPYLHDGRAKTLEQAIAFHGGESADSTIRYFMLSPRKRQLVIAFLKTLVAPDAGG